MTTPRELLARYATQSQLGNFFVDIIGIIAAASYGAESDGATDDTSAIQSAITANPRALTTLKPNTIFDHKDLSLSTRATLLSIGNGYLNATDFRGNYHLQGSGNYAQAPAFSKQVDSDVSTATTAAQYFIGDIKLHNVTGAAPVGLANAESDFSIISIGDRYSPTAGHGANINQVFGAGKYVEHRTDQTVTSGIGAEIATSIYGGGTFTTAKGVIATAQVAQNFTGGIIGDSGSGTIATGIGTDSSATVQGTASTGTITTAIGVRANVINQGSGTIGVAYGIQSRIINSGSGAVTYGYGFINSNTISGGSVNTLTGAWIQNTTPSGGATITKLYGLYVAAQTGGTNNKTAWIEGDLHITQGKRVILGGAAAVYDEAAKGTTASIYATAGIPYVDTAAKEATAFFGNNGPGTQCKAIANNAAGIAGEIAIDNTGGTKYLCVWVASNTVQRVALSAF